MAQSFTNYSEKRFNGVTYETVVKAVNAGAMSYALKDFHAHKIAMEQLGEDFSEKDLLQDLYELKYKQIVEATRRNLYMNDIFNSIVLNNEPIDLTPKL